MFTYNLSSSNLNYMKCVICGRPMRSVHEQHNAEPVAQGVCCDWCNVMQVIPKRLEQHKHLIDTINL